MWFLFVIAVVVALLVGVLLIRAACFQRTTQLCRDPHQF